MSLDFHITPRSPSKSFAASIAQTVNTTADDTSIYEPIRPPSLDLMETSYTRVQHEQSHGGGGGGGGGGDTNQGAQWLDMSRLCVFVEACTATRDQARPSISLRGTGQRYTHVALEIAQAVEQLQLPTPVCI